MPFSLIPFMLLAIPLLEIAVFVIIGGQIGVFATLAMIVVTALIGSFLLRAQGIGLINRVRADMDAGKIPTRDLVHGFMIAIAGVLLLTPGFVTDALGFLLFIPPVRAAVWKLVKSRITVAHFDGDGMRSRQSDRPFADETVIDLDDDEFKRDPDPNSPWNDR